MDLPPDPFSHTSSLSRQGHVPAALLGTLWISAVIAGFSAAILYEQTPAPPHKVATHWPEVTRCEPPRDRPMLVLFIHPKCPCTRASLAEVARLHRLCGEKLDMQFVFLERGNAPWDSTDTEHWETVREINAGPAFVDADGIEHRRFGASTSGEAFLYLPSGKLAFQGGLTVARGHFGESAGTDAISALVGNATPTRTRTPVYGCPLEAVCKDGGACPCTAMESAE